jgi:hypothetical protein
MTSNQNSRKEAIKPCTRCSIDSKKSIYHGGTGPWKLIDMCNDCMKLVFIIPSKMEVISRPLTN